jgi:hypothetical protein
MRRRGTRVRLQTGKVVFGSDIISLVNTVHTIDKLSSAEFYQQISSAEFFSMKFIPYRIISTDFLLPNITNEIAPAE